MDVERIQKINSLALDLMKQGLATDREDAIRQAERTFQNKSDSYSEIRERLEEVKHDAEPKQEIKEKTDDLSQDQIKNILEQNTKFLIKTIKGFQEKVEYLERELNHLKTKMAYERLPTVKEIRDEVPPPQPSIDEKEKVFVQEAVIPAPVSKPVPQAPPISENNSQRNSNHPRSGVFNEEDVSIEKVFYMGR